VWRPSSFVFEREQLNLHDVRPSRLVQDLMLRFCQRCLQFARSQ
jgi:hypothetical protein